MKSVLAIISTMIILLVGLGVFSKMTKPEPVKVGQVWIDESSNPFKSRLTTRKVIAVSGEYVQYVWDEKYTNSIAICIFTAGARVVKDTKCQDIIATNSIQAGDVTLSTNNVWRHVLPGVEWDGATISMRCQFCGKTNRFRRKIKQQKGAKL